MYYSYMFSYQPILLDLQWLVIFTACFTLLENNEQLTTFGSLRYLIFIPEFSNILQIALRQTNQEMDAVVIQQRQRPRQKENTRVCERVGRRGKEKESSGTIKRRLGERGEREGERRGVARENVSWPRSRVTTLRTAAPRPARFPPWRREDPPHISVPHYYSICRSRRRGPSSCIGPGV